jgi:hypothetical protein
MIHETVLLMNERKEGRLGGRKKGKEGGREGGKGFPNKLGKHCMLYPIPIVISGITVKQIPGHTLLEKSKLRD